jgi:hypothetical protein
MGAVTEEQERRDEVVVRQVAARDRRKLLYALGAGLALVLSILWNVIAWNRPVVGLPAEATEAQLRIWVALVVDEVESYRKEHGELPPNLEVLGLPIDGFDYVRDGQEYYVSAEKSGSRLEHVSEGERADLLIGTAFWEAAR